MVFLNFSNSQRDDLKIKWLLIAHLHVWNTEKSIFSIVLNTCMVQYPQGHRPNFRLEPRGGEWARQFIDCLLGNLSDSHTCNMENRLQCKFGMGMRLQILKDCIVYSHRTEWYSLKISSRSWWTFFFISLCIYLHQSYFWLLTYTCLRGLSVIDLLRIERGSTCGIIYLIRNLKNILKVQN